MKKSQAAIVLAVIAVLAIGGVVFATNRDSRPTKNETAGHSDMNMSNPSQTNNEAESTSPAAANNVEIKDFAFTPAKITVKKGTTVTWTNKDSAKHDITPDKQSADFKGSELLGQNESYEFTFNTIGTFSYNCSPHPYMKASVEVTE